MSARTVRLHLRGIPTGTANRAHESITTIFAEDVVGAYRAIRIPHHLKSFLFAVVIMTEVKDFSGRIPLDHPTFSFAFGICGLETPLAVFPPAEMLAVL